MDHPGCDFVALELYYPAGNSLLEVPRKQLIRFLRLTYVMVPRGQETHYQDIDTVLARLLS